MENKDRKICKIDDPRLSGYTKRTRSGSEQIFYTGDDERDFDRYRAEGGNTGKQVKMHDKPDTIRLRPSEQSYYSMLINGEWWWVDACDQCNGRERNGYSYMGECLKHDVCRSCSKPRKDFKTVWGGKLGWQCEPCQESEHEEEKQKALAAMSEEFDPWDYHCLSDIKCPYCDYKFSDSSESYDDDDEEHECPRCDNTFTVTANHSVTFDCNRKEKP